ncbi:MAG: hypothetical protein KA240_03795 [Nitrospira sp.]|nr:hypothetical protein [Nitrospira sp.]MBP6604781.1 hypothetical protein [Nitrospira sp.]HQY57589.1 transglutaminase domain-containing protein [Nitrospira sp.]HRA97218.1 transglutaminase domain-containing protein [Nitrospira sp.]
MGVRDRAYMHHRDSLATSRMSTRRVMAISLVLIGLVSWYRLTDTATDQARPNIQQAVPVPAISHSPARSPAHPYQRYLDAVVPESDTLRALAYTKVKGCPAGDRTCMLTELYRFVQHDIGYLDDPVAREHIQSPQATLQIGAGDCEDLSILLASLLDNVGIPNYLVFTNNHTYTLACDVDPSTMAPTLAERYAIQPPPVQRDETRSIPPHSLSVTRLDATTPTQVGIEFHTNGPLDWMVVPSQEDVEAIQQGRPYQTYPSCSRDGVTSFRATCVILVGAPLVAYNRHETPVELAIRLRYQIAPVAPTLPPIKTYALNDAQCVPLDPSIKGQAYPGQIMPSVVTAPYRTAVNRAGKVVALDSGPTGDDPAHFPLQPQSLTR